MSTFTKEWLQQTIAEYEANRDELPFGLDTNSAIELQAFKLALASLEAEPVGFIARHKETGKFGSYLHPKADWFKNGEYEVLNAYTTPPATVSVPDFGALTKCIVQRLVDYGAADDDAIASAEEFVYNACRAAMLQGAEPVTTAYKLPVDFDFNRFNDVVWLEAVASNPHMHSLTTSTIAMVALELNRRMNVANSPVMNDYPETLPCPVSLEPGLKFGKGVATKILLEALQSRANYSAEIEVIKEVCGDIKDGDFLAAAKINGSSELVTTAYKLLDGYTLVPVEPTYQMCEAMGLPWESPRFPDRYKAMIAAAPDFREIVNSSTNNFRENAETSTKCWCHTCRPVTITDMRFVVCPECGNKRCPHANDHRNGCTGSNEPGQEGSAYPAAPQQEAKNV